MALLCAYTHSAVSFPRAARCLQRRSGLGLRDRCWAHAGCIGSFKGFVPQAKVVILYYSQSLLGPGLWRRSLHQPNLRQTWRKVQARAGFVVALIVLLSSYDHISFPAGIRFQLQQQWGVWFIVASMALVVADAQLATQSRYREADQRLEAANEAAEERIRADRESNRAAEERILASEERVRSDRERERAALRAQQQARCNRVQLCHQFDPNEVNAQRVRDVISLLDEYGGLA